MDLSLHDEATFALLDFEVAVTEDLLLRASEACEGVLGRVLPDTADVMVEDRAVVFEIEGLRFKVEKAPEHSELGWRVLIFSTSAWVPVSSLTDVGRVLRRLGYRPVVKVSEGA